MAELRLTAEQQAVVVRQLTTVSSLAVWVWQVSKLSWKVNET